jgi:hypothetical protein
MWIRIRNTGIFSVVDPVRSHSESFGQVEVGSGSGKGYDILTQKPVLFDTFLTP